MKQKFSVFLFIFFGFVFLLKDLNLFEAIQSMRFDQNTSKAVPEMTAKKVMLDHVNAYIMSPLSQRLEQVVHLSSLWPSLSANQVSYAGVVVACVASRVVVNDSLVVRRLAVLIFLLRQFLDDLDGLIARIRMGIDRRTEISVTGTSGYVVDGLCDAVGFTAFLVAVFLFSFRRKNDSKYKLLTDDSGLSSSSSSSGFDDGRRLLLRNHVLFGLQMLLSCVLWNRYIDAFHRILETEVTPIKVEIFKSRLQWLIMWAWRCFGNAHQLMNFFLVSVWLSRSHQFLERIHFFGFVLLIGLSFLTEIHLNDIETYLKHISMN